MKKAIYITIGMVILVIAVIGIAIPGVPTTPLLLLTLYCFGKSSEKLTAWFKRTPLYKRYIHEYTKKKAMTRKQKLCIQIFAGIMMALSCVAVRNWIFWTVMAAACLMHNYVFIFRIKTYKPEHLETEINVSN